MIWLALLAVLSCAGLAIYAWRLSRALDAAGDALRASHAALAKSTEASEDGTRQMLALVTKLEGMDKAMSAYIAARPTGPRPVPRGGFRG